MVHASSHRTRVEPRRRSRYGSDRERTCGSRIAREGEGMTTPAITGPVQDLSTHRLPPNFRGRPAWLVQIWWLVQSLLFHTSPQFMYGWRRFLLRLFGAKIGKNVMLRPSVTVTYPWKLAIGDDSWIGDHVTLYTLGPIVIGRDAVVSQHSYLAAASHDYTRPSFDIFQKQITIE